ncbi:MAG: DUF308 domain-containing protein [Erysipelotrichaceae bacterium]|nr:DUF308 domain-containing protein [Erysipelotrichaceae bacterium]
MTFFKSIKKNSIIVSAMYGLIGYFLILQKEKSFDMVMTILATGLVAAGFFSVIRYFLLKIEERFKRNDFAIGVVLVALGVIIYLIKNNISDLADYIFGVMMIVNGLFCIQDAFDAKYVGVSSIGVYLLLMLIEIGIGAAIIMKVFGTESTKYIVIGSGMLLCAVESVLSNIFLAIYRTGYEAKNRRQAREEALKNETKPEPEPAPLFTEEDSKPDLEFKEPELPEDDPEEEKPLE